MVAARQRWCSARSRRKAGSAGTPGASQTQQLLSLFLGAAVQGESDGRGGAGPAPFDETGLDDAFADFELGISDAPVRHPASFSDGAENQCGPALMALTAALPGAGSPAFILFH